MYGHASVGVSVIDSMDTTPIAANELLKKAKLVFPDGMSLKVVFMTRECGYFLHLCTRDDLEQEDYQKFQSKFVRAVHDGTYGAKLVVRDGGRVDITGVSVCLSRYNIKGVGSAAIVPVRAVFTGR